MSHPNVWGAWVDDPGGWGGTFDSQLQQQFEQHQRYDHPNYHSYSREQLQQFARTNREERERRKEFARETAQKARNHFALMNCLRSQIELVASKVMQCEAARH